MGSDEYEAGWRAGHGEAKQWVLILDRYERDNLLFLINMLGFPTEPGLEPFHLLNSGGWTASIGEQLAMPGTEAAFQMTAEKTGCPALTTGELLVRLGEWFAERAA